MSNLQNLREAKSLDDMARLLRFTPMGLSFILYKLAPDAKYTSFEIPKRNGGKRQIKAPVPRLSLLQKRLAKLLYACLNELGASKPPRRSLAHGFEKKRSIITNASLHKRRRYVLNLDLRDFFPSINFGRVRGFFIRDRAFLLNEKTATIIAQIACHDNELPQGSPCSPVISNLVGQIMDNRLARFAKANKCTYSRYADDITFSTSKKAFPTDIAFPIAGTTRWQIGSELQGKIERSGFKVNESKTRMQFRDSRQVTTGLMVNEKVNIRAEYWRMARHMCHSLFKTGSYFKTIAAAPVGASGAAIPPARLVFKKTTMLGGMLAHIYQVKEKADKKRLEDKVKQATGARRLYSNFLFYNNFVALDSPLIVPEGKTDHIYIRNAAHRLTDYHPRLGSISGGKFVSKVRHMKFSKTVIDVLSIGSGVSNLKIFVKDYEKRVKFFGHAPLRHPVIVLVDNDDGGKDMFSIVNSEHKFKIAFDSVEPFYYLGLNLYLVKTPEASTAPFKSCIENLFDPKLLKTFLGGKTLALDKKHKEPGKYGKEAFAKNVVVPGSATIDFSGFKPLLDRVVAVLDHYAAIVAAK